MTDRVAVTIEQFAARVRGQYPQYRDLQDLELVHKVVQKFPQFSIELQDGRAVRVSWARPELAQTTSAASATSAEQKSASTTTTDDSASISGPVRDGEVRVTASSRPILGVATIVQRQPEPEALSSPAILSEPSSASVDAATTGRVFNFQGASPDQSVEITSNQLPIAAALPAWDLVPANTLLVRRRTASR